MAFLVHLTFDELRKEDAIRSNSHQLISLASYSSASDPRYAAIWREVPQLQQPLPRQIWKFWPRDEPQVPTEPLLSPLLVTMTGAVTEVGGPPGVTTTVVYEVYGPNDTVPKVSFVSAAAVGELLKDVSATSEALAIDAVWYRREGEPNQFRVAGLFRSKAAKAVWGGVAAMLITPRDGRLAI